MLKIIEIEIIAALAVLLWYEVLCVLEKRAAIRSEKDWRVRMERKVKQNDAQ